MTIVVTYIEVQQDRTSDALALIGDYGKSSGGEAGLSAMDAFQEIHRSNRFVIVETWPDDATFHLHENADHTLQFRSGLKGMHNCPNDQRIHSSFAVGRRPQELPLGALSVVTHVDVPPPRREATELLLRRIAEESAKEPGNLRYDVLQQHEPRTNHFTVVECWADAGVFAAHETLPHTLEFREALGPMLGAPYDDRLYRLMPG